MAELYAPPDVEAAAVAYLNPALSVPVANRVPTPRPASHVRVTSAGGGGQVSLVQSVSRLLVECWAPDSVAALDLARRSWALFWAVQHDWMAGAWISQAELTDPVNFPDPDAPRSARYQFVAQLTVALERLEETP